jgi:hypothetical protein
VNIARCYNQTVANDQKKKAAAEGQKWLAIWKSALICEAYLH